MPKWSASVKRLQRMKWITSGDDSYTAWSERNYYHYFSEMATRILINFTCNPPSNEALFRSWSAKFLSSSPSFCRTISKDWGRTSLEHVVRRAIRRTTSWLRVKRSRRQNCAIKPGLILRGCWALREELLRKGCSIALFRRLGNAGWVIRGPKNSASSWSTSLSFSLVKFPLLMLVDEEFSPLPPAKSTTRRQQQRRCLSASIP